MQRRLSIQESFTTWSKLSALLLLLLSLLLFLTFDTLNAFKRSENLLYQKSLTQQIAEIGRTDLPMAVIVSKGKGTQLFLAYEKLETLSGYDLLAHWPFAYHFERGEDLSLLKEKILTFNSASEAWYREGDEALQRRGDILQNSRYQLLTHIDHMLLKQIQYQAAKFPLKKWVTFGVFFLGLLIFVNYTFRFKTIARDIQSLYAIQTKESDYRIVTDEIDLISKRMHRKHENSDNPAMQDPITEVKNYKGLLHAFANRKGKEGATVALCVFEIDGFKELDRNYPKSFTQAVLKKIAFMLSLHEQHTDILARTDYSQFTLLLLRNSMEDAYEVCERIRKAIEEGVFKPPHGQNISLTLSGGLVKKTPRSSLEETIEMARDVLVKGKSIEPNSIKQPKDVVLA